MTYKDYMANNLAFCYSLLNSSTSTDLIKSILEFFRSKSYQMPMVHLSTIQLSDNVEQKVSITRVKKRGWVHGEYVP